MRVRVVTVAGGATQYADANCAGRDTPTHARAHTHTHIVVEVNLGHGHGVYAHQRYRVGMCACDMLYDLMM